MLHVPASELQKQFGHYQDRALVEPVFVTRNGRERTVLISTEEYYRLKQNDDRRILPPEQRPDHSPSPTTSANAPTDNVPRAHDTITHKLNALEHLTSTHLPTVPPLSDEGIRREHLHRFDGDGV